jgi:hypothetical protein
MTRNLLLKLLPAFSILATLGTLIGFAIDRVSGRAISNFQFFKQGLMPDGIHYEVRTLRFLGKVDSEILTSIGAQYKHTGLVVTEYFLNPDSWEAALVDPRILFSLLSIIFVKLLGLTGFFVVPMSCFALLSLSPLYFNKQFLDNRQKTLAFGLVLLLVGSFYAKFNLLANTTDGLSAFLIVQLVLLMLKNFYGKVSKWDTLTIPLTCLLACMTRQNEIYVAGLVLIFFFNKRRENRKVATFVTLNSLIMISIWFLYSFVNYNNYAIITDSSGESLGGASLVTDVLGLVFKLPQILAIESFQLLIRDVGVFVILLIAISLIFPLKSITITQQMFLWVMFSGILLTSVNGSFGSGFRYAMPCIYLAAFSILEFWSKRSV